MEAQKVRRKKLLKHRSFAFLIGINEYPNIGNLISPVRDVNVLSKVLQEEQGFDHVGKMLNADAASIRQLLKWLGDDQVEIDNGQAADLPANILWLEAPKAEAEETSSEANAPNKISKEDYVVFYFAGHGVSREMSDQSDRPPVGFLMPSDASMDSELIEMKDIFLAFDRTGCKHLLLILDCCFAGSIRFISKTRSSAFGGRPFYEDRFESFLQKKSRQVLVSS
ncbi:MAG: caspase family protein, partial [Bacteroidota bacterium]